jgi:hypothetical protein
MTLLMITYCTATRSLIATISDELELKVGYLPDENKVVVIKKDKVITTADVTPKFTATAFIDYCLRTAKYFGL